MITIFRYLAGSPEQLPLQEKSRGFELDYVPAKPDDAN